MKQGSIVNIRALDYLRHFDRVDRYALWQLLMDRLLRKNFIGILLDWFSKCFWSAFAGKHFHFGFVS